MKFIFTLLFFVSFSNTAFASWYIGKWKVDEVKTYSIIGEENRGSFVGLVIDMMKDQTLEIAEEKFSLVSTEQTLEFAYDIKNLSDKSVILDLKEIPRDWEFGNDPNGTYMVVKEETKVNGKVVESKTYNVYLKPF
jgi:hypothetical protein